MTLLPKIAKRLFSSLKTHSSLAKIDCRQAFKLVGLTYDPKKYACYNEVLSERKLCPFAAIDACISRELPDPPKLSDKEKRQNIDRVWSLIQTERIVA